MNPLFELKARSAALHRRKAHINRADIDNLPGLGDDEPTKTPSIPTTTPHTAQTTTPITPVTPITTKPDTISTTNPIISAPSVTPPTVISTPSTSTTDKSSTTSSSSSSSSTSSSSSSKSSSTSSSSSPTSILPSASSQSVTVETLKGSRTVATVTYTSSSSTATNTAAISNSDTTTSSGGVSAGSIVGAIFGTIGGILVVAIIVAFVVRRIRARKRDEEHFDAANFRRSAALLDDEFGNDNFPARPPSMIARHMAVSPSIPPPTPTYGNYPGADPYGAGESFPPGVGGNPFSNPQYYSNYTQEPVYTLNPGDTFPPSNPIVPSASAGSTVEMDPTTARNTYLNRQPTLRETDTPHADVSEQYMDMNRVPSPPMAAMHPAAAYDTGLASPTSATPLRNPHAVEYPSVGVPAAALAAASAPATRAAAPVDHAAGALKRPETVYDPEDAYGGM